MEGPSIHPHAIHTRRSSQLPQRTQRPPPLILSPSSLTHLDRSKFFFQPAARNGASCLSVCMERQAHQLIDRADFEIIADAGWARAVHTTEVPSLSVGPTAAASPTHDHAHDTSASSLVELLPPWRPDSTSDCTWTRKLPACSQPDPRRSNTFRACSSLSPPIHTGAAAVKDSAAAAAAAAAPCKKRKRALGEDTPVPKQPPLHHASLTVSAKQPPRRMGFVDTLRDWQER